jgi:pentatricopeptide repeat protein
LKDYVELILNNTIINAYVKKGDFLAVEKILKVMKKENVTYNAATYDFDWVRYK